RGPAGFPIMMLANGSTRTATAATFINTVGARSTGHGFLDDIAHHAVPGLIDHDNNPATPPVNRTPDADPGTADDGIATTYDDELLNAHFVTGDGRGNENIA